MILFFSGYNNDQRDSVRAVARNQVNKVNLFELTLINTIGIDALHLYFNSHKVYPLKFSLRILY